MDNCQKFAAGFVSHWGNFLTDFDKFYSHYKTKQNDDEKRLTHETIQENLAQSTPNQPELDTHDYQNADNTQESSKKMENSSEKEKQLQGMNGEAITEANHSSISGKDNNNNNKDNCVPQQKKKKLVRLKEKANQEEREREQKEKEEKENEERLLKKKIKKERRKKKLLDTDDSDCDFKIKKKVKDKQ